MKVFGWKGQFLVKERDQKPNRRKQGKFKVTGRAQIEGRWMPKGFQLNLGLNHRFNNSEKIFGFEACSSHEGPIDIGAMQ